MKTVELLIDEHLDDMGVMAVSVVRFPAIEENWVYFNKGGQYVLAKADEEQQMLVGPALIPEKRILRIDEQTGEEYEVFFSAETIRKVSERYMQEERTNQHTYEHSADIDGLTVVQSWIIEDEQKDKAALYGFELPVGTWMLSVKVNNQQIWEQVKKGEVRGFSIEGFFLDEVLSASRTRKPCQDCPDDPQVMMELRELILAEMAPVIFVDGEPLWETPEEAELFGELFRECLGHHEHTINGVTLYMACTEHPKGNEPKVAISTDNNANK